MIGINLRGYIYKTQVCKYNIKNSKNLKFGSLQALTYQIG